MNLSPEQFHLAEVMLSGLIERVTPQMRQFQRTSFTTSYWDREMLVEPIEQGDGGLDEAMRPVQERLRAFVEGHTRTAIATSAHYSPIPKPRASPRLSTLFVEVSRRIMRTEAFSGLRIRCPVQTAQIEPKSCERRRGQCCIDERHRQLSRVCQQRTAMDSSMDRMTAIRRAI